MRKDNFFQQYFVVITIVFCMVVLITGCTILDEFSKEPEIKEMKEEKPIEIKPKKGGELKLAIRKPANLNPLLNDDAAIQPLFELLFDSLIMYDENHKPTANLAKNWDFLQEGQMIQLELREDVTWHDGTPLTADDVVFTLDTIKKASTSPYKKYIENISNYRAVDEKTIKITYIQPFSGALYALNFPIIPAHYYKNQNVFNTEKNMNPIGTGPYIFVSLDSNKEIQLKANDNYFKGSPYIPKAKAIFIPDDETSFYTFEQGQINVLEMKRADWQKYSTMENAKIYEYTIPYYDFIGFNFKNPKFQSIALRKAIAYSIDRKALLDKYYLGHGVISDTPFLPNAWFLPEKSLIYSYSKEKGQQLLENSDEKIQMKLLVSNENPIRVNVAEEIKNMLAQVGIEVIVESVSIDTYIERLKKGDFEAFLGGWKLSPLIDFTFAFHSTQIPEVFQDGKNYIRYQDSTLDQLLKECFTSVEENKIKQSYQNFNQYFIENLPYVSLYFQNSALIMNDIFYGPINPTMYSSFKNVNQWFIYSSEEE